MTLQQTISTQLGEALKCGNKERLRALRLLKTELQVAERSGRQFKEADVVRSYAGSLRKSVEEYERLGRPDLAQKMQKDLKVVEEFLPPQMSAAELERLLAGLIAQHGYGPGDVGKVMRTVMSEHGGEVDGRLAQQIARRLLGS